MHSAAIDTIYAKQFEFVLTIQSNEVVMDKTLLRKFIFIRYSIEVKACTKIILSSMKR
jgi:hypothetical protein